MSFKNQNKNNRNPVKKLKNSFSSFFRRKIRKKVNFVIWPLCPTENTTYFSNCRQESKQNKSEIEKERTQLFCAIFFILAFIKHVYQQIWRVSHVFHSFLHQIKRILLFKINHQWWQWYRRFGQCWPQYLTASKGKQREKDENSEFFWRFSFSVAKIAFAICCSGRWASPSIRLLFMVQSQILGEVSSSQFWSEPTIDRLFFNLWAVLEAF